MSVFISCALSLYYSFKFLPLNTFPLTPPTPPTTDSSLSYKLMMCPPSPNRSNTKPWDQLPWRKSVSAAATVRWRRKSSKGAVVPELVTG